MAFFWQVLFTPQTWMPAGGGDLVPFLLPNFRFAAQSLQSGILPLWNPHLYSGVPFAADTQSGLFYPVNLIVFLFNPNITVQTLEHLAIFHFWLAGFGMFLFLRHSPFAQKINLHLLAAFAGAVAFEFSDLFIVHFGNLNMIAVAAWLPLIFLTFQRALAEKRLACALLSGTLLALATLASHIQITLFILLAMGLFTLWEMAISYQSSVFSLKPLGYLLLTLLVMMGLSALWLIPTLEMSRYTLRADLPYPEAAAYSLNPAQLIGLLIPNYFGRDPALHWGVWARVETGYIGILTLFLALIGALWQKSRDTRFWIFLGGISFLLALGDNFILHGLLSLSPAFGQFRAPARYIFLLDFSLATLAAIGLHQLMSIPAETLSAKLGKLLKPITWAIGGILAMGLPLAYFALFVTQDRDPAIFNRAQSAVTGVVTFAVLAIASLIFLHSIRLNRLKKTAIGMGAILLIGLDLFSLGANVDVGHADPTAAFEHPAAIEFLRENAGINRIETATDVWHLWQPNTALLNGLFDAWGIYNPLTLAKPTQFWEGFGTRKSAAYNLLGVKYLIGGKGGAPADGNFVSVFDADPAVNIYLNLSALPRVIFVPHAQIVGSSETAWTALHAPNFDPTQNVILENAPPQNQPAPTQTPELAILRYEPQRVEISVKSDGAGYLFLSDADYPGWVATIDGESAPIFRANYAFRAVPVSAGEHLIRFEFKPLSWKIGLAVSALTLLLLVIWSGWNIYKAKH